MIRIRVRARLQFSSHLKLNWAADVLHCHPTSVPTPCLMMSPPCCTQRWLWVGKN